jgi:hypothetical protein
LNEWSLWSAFLIIEGKLKYFSYLPIPIGQIVESERGNIQYFNLGLMTLFGITNYHWPICWLICFILYLTVVSILALMTGNPVYLISTKGALRMWPVSRGCVLLRGSWSYLCICRGSVLAYTRFCNCLLDYDYVLHIVNFAIRNMRDTTDGCLLLGLSVIYGDHCRWRAVEFRPMLGVFGPWAGWDLYRDKLWHQIEDFPVSSKGPLYLVASYDK